MSSKCNKQETSWRSGSIISHPCLAITIKSGLLMTWDSHLRASIKAVLTRLLQVPLQSTIVIYLKGDRTLHSKRLLILIREHTTTTRHHQTLISSNLYTSSIMHSPILTQTLLTIKDPPLPSNHQRPIWTRVQTLSLYRAHLPNPESLPPIMLSHSILILTFNSTNSIYSSSLQLKFWIKTKQLRYHWTTQNNNQWLMWMLSFMKTKSTYKIKINKLMKKVTQRTPTTMETKRTSHLSQIIMRLCHQAQAQARPALFSHQVDSNRSKARTEWIR